MLSLQRACDAFLRTWVPWVVLSLSLACAWLWWQDAQPELTQRELTQLERRSAEISARLQERTRAHEQVLGAAAALFETHTKMTRTHWRDFAARLGARNRYPELRPAPTGVTSC